MLRKVPMKDAVGEPLSHDITEIRPGEFKGPAFRKGHIICDEDLCHLQKLGKNHLYLIDEEKDEIHEDRAAAILARGLAGPGIEWQDNPREGKVSLYAGIDGLLVVDKAALASFNMVDEVMCASLHNYTLVKKGRQVAATRAIPLVMKKAPVERAAAIAGQNGGAISVHPLNRVKAGVVITGNEVFNGLIQDRFAPVLKEKIENLGSTLEGIEFVPDSETRIEAAIQKYLDTGCRLILLTGGMSVDPDDVTRKGIELAGATEINYGTAVLPGAMFLVAYVGQIPLLGVPACGLYHKITVLDLILPRILINEHIGKKELAFLGHGGLCMDCQECIYPRCSFGKGV